MDIRLQDNKAYEYFNVLDIFEGSKIVVKDDMLTKLAKELGFSYPLYRKVAEMDQDIANQLVSSVVGDKNIALLCSKDATDPIDEVLGYTLEERTPILNSDFVKRVCSLADTCDELEIAEVHYHKDDNISTVLLKKKSPISIEEKYLNGYSKYFDHYIGVLLVNEEMNTSYGRLVLYYEDHPVYLPASMYTTSISRYKKSTTKSTDALEVMVLKVIDDLREDALQSKIYDFYFKHKYILDGAVTYEEYNTLLKTMRKIPTFIDEPSILDPLLSMYEEFESKYAHMDDQSSSYIWRCTALGHITIRTLIDTAVSILNLNSAIPIEYFKIRDLIGSYVSTSRIAAEIAKEDI